MRPGILHLASTSILLFCFGLNVPQISQVVAYVLIALLLVKWHRNVARRAVVPFALLLAFCVTYYVVVASDGFVGLAPAIHRPAMFLCFYVFGCSLGRATTPGWPSVLIWPLTAMVGGFVMFTYLSTFATPADPTLAAMRAVGNFWGGDPILVTGVGLFASLGLCLLPVAFVGLASVPRRWEHVALAVTAGAIFVLALLPSGLFQNRSAVIALVATMGASFVIFLRAKTVRRRTKALVVSIVVVASLAIGRSETLADAAILGRFSEKGLATPRYDAWFLLIEGMPSHPLGGRSFGLGGLEFVHNVWLDVVYDAGIWPGIFLIAFHLLHVGGFFRIAGSNLPMAVKLGFIGLGISFLGGFMAEPALQSSAPYFAASCLLFGMSRGLAMDIGELPSNTAS